MLRSKSEALIVQVFDGSVLGEDDEALDRWMRTLFVLRVHHQLIERLAREATDHDLTHDEQLRANIAALFSRAASTLADPRTDESIRDHVVDLLTPILRELLARSFNFAEIVTLLAGSLDCSDAVFTVRRLAVHS